MSKLRLGFSRLAATQIDQISEVMSNQWHEQNERMNDMVWSSKSLLEDGFLKSMLSKILESVIQHRLQSLQ